MIRFTCSRCQTGVDVSEDHGGGFIYCPRCGQLQAVPTLLPLGADAGSVAFPRPDLRAPPGQPTWRVIPWSSRPGWLRAIALVSRRLGSPSVLILALLLFPLPWVEVRCDRPIGGSDSRVVAEQSGLQAAYGGYTEHPYVRGLRSGTERERIPPSLRARANAVSWAPAMALYPALLVGGITAGLAIRRPWLRGAVVIGCSAAAGAALLLQARAGFPLERALPATITTDVTQGGLTWETSAPTPFETHYTRWFWLSAVVVVGTVAVACLEVWPAWGFSLPNRKESAWKW